MKILFIIIWLISLVLTSIYVYENPDRIDAVKQFIKNEKKFYINTEEGNISRSVGNSFMVEFSKEVTFEERTAFIINDDKSQNFNADSLEIYFQNGYFSKGSELKKINLSKNFTTMYNGGLKTIFKHKNKKFAFISSLKDKCFYASIVMIENEDELFKTKCLPSKKIDFNGLGSSYIHHKGYILLSIGAPEQASREIRELAQNKNSFFGKIIKIDKNVLDNVIEGKEKEFQAEIFSLGHRNPQGLTKSNGYIFSVEHGPKGGDELNKIIENKNYGWPEVSYGTQYVYDEKGKAYEINHEINLFEEPLFAFVPSVGISAVNVCPAKLLEYYKKPCLLALSLFGNSHMPGRSLIIYLLNEKMDKVHSTEKIYLRDNLKLRHFVTNSKNELYEDKDGNIYISADKEGIYKISFKYFRN